MSMHWIYDSTRMGPLVMGGLSGVLCLCFLLTPSGYAETEGVLLTNRGEKHADNPDARIHPSEPDPTWRQPRPIPQNQQPLVIPSTRNRPGAPNAGVNTPASSSSGNHATSRSDAPRHPQAGADRTSIREQESARNNALPPPVTTRGTGAGSTAGSSIRPDGMEGYRIRETDGGTSTVRPDGMGGYRTRSGADTGSIRPDGMGGYRIQESHTTGGQPTRMRPDGLGGYRIRESDGSTSTMRPDGLGGYRIREADGSTTRVRPDGLGGYRRN